MPVGIVEDISKTAKEQKERIAATASQETESLRKQAAILGKASIAKVRPEKVSRISGRERGPVGIKETVPEMEKAKQYLTSIKQQEEASKAGLVEWKGEQEKAVEEWEKEKLAKVEELGDYLKTSDTGEQTIDVLGALKGNVSEDTLKGFGVTQEQIDSGRQYISAQGALSKYETSEKGKYDVVKALQEGVDSKYLETMGLTSDEISTFQRMADARKSISKYEKTDGVYDVASGIKEGVSPSTFVNAGISADDIAKAQGAVHAEQEYLATTAVIGTGERVDLSYYESLKRDNPDAAAKLDELGVEKFNAWLKEEKSKEEAEELTAKAAEVKADAERQEFLKSNQEFLKSNLVTTINGVQYSVPKEGLTSAQTTEFMRTGQIESEYSLPSRSGSEVKFKESKYKDMTTGEILLNLGWDKPDISRYVATYLAKEWPSYAKDSSAWLKEEHPDWGYEDTKHKMSIAGWDTPVGAYQAFVPTGGTKEQQELHKKQWENYRKSRDARITMAYNSYTKEYGGKSWWKPTAISLSESFTKGITALVPAVKALHPGIDVKEVSGMEWGMSALAVVPIVAPYTGLTKVAAAVSKPITSAVSAGVTAGRASALTQVARVPLLGKTLVTPVSELGVTRAVATAAVPKTGITVGRIVSTPFAATKVAAVGTAKEVFVTPVSEGRIAGAAKAGLRISGKELAVSRPIPLPGVPTIGKIAGMKPSVSLRGYEYLPGKTRWGVEWGPAPEIGEKVSAYSMRPYITVAEKGVTSGEPLIVGKGEIGNILFPFETTETAGLEIERMSSELLLSRLPPPKVISPWTVGQVVRTPYTVGRAALQTAIKGYQGAKYPFTGAGIKGEFRLASKGLGGIWGAKIPVKRFVPYTVTPEIESGAVEYLTGKTAELPILGEMKPYTVGEAVMGKVPELQRGAISVAIAEPSVPSRVIYETGVGRTGALGVTETPGQVYGTGYAGGYAGEAYPDIFGMSEEYLSMVRIPKIVEEPLIMGYAAVTGGAVARGVAPSAARAIAPSIVTPTRVAVSIEDMPVDVYYPEWEGVPSFEEVPYAEHIIIPEESYFEKAVVQPEPAKWSVSEFEETSPVSLVTELSEPEPAGYDISYEGDYPYFPEYAQEEPYVPKPSDIIPPVVIPLGGEGVPWYGTRGGGLEGVSERVLAGLGFRPGVVVVMPDIFGAPGVAKKKVVGRGRKLEFKGYAKPRVSRKRSIGKPFAGATELMSIAGA